jgi:hypothetical protein
MSESPQTPQPPQKVHREKEEEKEEEKRHEKGGEEKSWDEKWRRDPINAGGWAVILIWAGLVLLGENLGMLARLAPLDAWHLILIGAGLILLIGAAIRLSVPAYRRPVGGAVILGLVLLAAGISELGRTEIIWSAALILLGVFFLLRGLMGKK